MTQDEIILLIEKIKQNLEKALEVLEDGPKETDDERNLSQRN
jgi:hypothetical protein